ncbi:hypothetical protein [Bacillus sp. NPDC077027]|uniref:hypothetical protein n=1 Tax=Bacillus sp. NPDC077027 TaxID=3390548 RepID=UPI003D0895FA
MTIHLHCLHAHASNIEYINQALTNQQIALHHHVDADLMIRLTRQPPLDLHQQQAYVARNVEQLAQKGADMILLTCTQYIALLDEQLLTTSVPVIKLDEPLFDVLCAERAPLQLVFSNPGTVDGTMQRLFAFADEQGISVEAEAVVMTGVFDLLMAGDKVAYEKQVEQQLYALIEQKKGILCAAQLSMVGVAQRVARTTGQQIVHPLAPLVQFVEKQVQLLL